MSKKEQFAVLEGYPKDGPEMPEREKVHREKNKHESGTGRRDREKREGRGQSNWGNPLDDVNHSHSDCEEPEDDTAVAPAQSEKGPEYVAAGKFFDKDDAEDEVKMAKQVVKVPAEYVGIVKTGENVEVVPDDPNDPNRKLPKPQPKLEKKPKREPYVPEAEGAEHKEEEDAGDEAKGGKKPRDQQFKGVQHNRNYAAPPAGH
ncbi:hypothetical protein TRFO_15906 [Tritrichomonas foetus]|uniref:Hyaluronan/mRNA-binding protein domain-containing protein n=1 Tax=Tritrichomonas foetus TaxID=1144522 RepID=A0A1J4KSL8_9EUKA|nr:hypothetical protein TRFO_15906 [Tritrichomonas foetus]|eukprot:OHT13880.1 hypothetical protein TRFO_15906 [Tritrichomonas foetus]